MRRKGTMTLNQYKDYKLRILRQLGYKNIPRETFAKATTEIQIDNIARNIILS